jgi:hypothetical protein
MKRFSSLLVVVLPLLLVPVAFVAVLRTGEPAPLVRASLPTEPHQADRCTWYCHNHGCRHRPRLPRVLAGDDGLFGATIHALKRAGTALVPSNPAVGYGVVNLLVFCFLWPGLMLGLLVVAVRQRRSLRALEEG